MNKAILVIDMPESCDKCPLFHGFYTDMTCGANNCGIDYPYPKDFRQNWCPLKPMPEPFDLTIPCSDPHYEHEFEYGYNQCIEDFLNGDQDDSWPEYRVEIIGEQK